MSTTPRTPWYANRWACRFAWALVLFGLVSGVVGGLRRGLHDEPDWRAFVKETTFVWQHHEIPPWTGMFGYLPAANFLLWPMTVWLPRQLGLITFVAMNGAATIATVWILYRYWFNPPAPGEHASRQASNRLALFGWALFVLGAHFQNVLQGNQLTILLLFLCVAGFALIERSKPWLGGFLIGVAACLKVTPAILFLFLLLKRRWAAAVAMALAFITVDIVPSVVFFGPAQAIQEHKAWLDRVDWYANERFIEDPWLRVMHHGHEHNSSLAVVLTRWLREQPGDGKHIVVRGHPPMEELERIRSTMQPGDHLSIDPMPDPERSWSVNYHEPLTRASLPRSSIASWSPRQVWLLWLLIECLVMGTTVWVTLRSNRNSDVPSQWQCLCALWLLVSLWPSPMLRDYYLPLALPAAVVVWRTILNYRLAKRRTLVGLAAASMLICFVSVLCLASRAAEWYGIHFAAIAGLTAAIILCCVTGQSETKSPPVACPTET